jgi:hypothetical protein
VLCGGIVVAGCTWFLDLAWLQSELLPAHLLAAAWAAVIGWRAFEEGRWGLTALAWFGLWIVAAIVGVLSSSAGLAPGTVGGFLLPLVAWGGFLVGLLWIVRRSVSEVSRAE